MTTNILIAFVLIFISHQTRNFEVVNLKLIDQIGKKKQQININQIEFALHNDHKYLKKLFSLYLKDFNNKKLSNVISISEFSNFKKKEFFKVGFK